MDTITRLRTISIQVSRLVPKVFAEDKVETAEIQTNIDSNLNEIAEDLEKKDKRIAEFENELVTQQCIIEKQKNKEIVKLENVLRVMAKRLLEVDSKYPSYIFSVEEVVWLFTERKAEKEEKEIKSP